MLLLLLLLLLVLDGFGEGAVDGNLHHRGGALRCRRGHRVGVTGEGQDTRVVRLPPGLPVSLLLRRPAR